MSSRIFNRVLLPQTGHKIHSTFLLVHTFLYITLKFIYAFGKYQVKYDRLFNRTFDNSKINRFIDTNTFLPPKEGLRICLEKFVEHPLFRPISYKMEGISDRQTGERISLMKIDTLKNRIKYFLFRYII